MLITRSVVSFTGWAATGSYVFNGMVFQADWNGYSKFPASLTDGIVVAPGVYRLTFETGAYQLEQGLTPFFPEVQVAFEIRQPGDHFHVPLVISPYGYSTYRGV